MLEKFNAIILRSKTILIIVFIIDNVQFSMNLLLVTLGLMFFGMFYFIVYMAFDGVQIEYLFFALGFQIISSQGVLTLVLTLVSKLWLKDMISRQLSYVLQCQYISKICTFLVLLSTDLTGQKLIDSPIYMIVLTILGLILVGLMVISKRSFSHLAYLGYQKLEYLQTQNPEDQVSLLQTLKVTLQTSSSAIALIGALLCSSSRSWFDQQYQVITLYFGINNTILSYRNMETAIYPGFMSYSAGILFLRLIAKSNYFAYKKLWLLSIASSVQIMSYFLAAMVGTCEFAEQTMRGIVYVLVTLSLQFSQAISFLCTYSLIGMREDMVDILGFQFGLLSTFLNVFELWILFAWFQTIDSQSRKIFQGEVFIGFCLTFSILALTISKLIIFSSQQRIQPQIKMSLRINKKLSYDSQRESGTLNSNTKDQELV